jgi:hypothetical protein
VECGAEQGRLGGGRPTADGGAAGAHREVAASRELARGQEGELARAAAPTVHVSRRDKRWQGRKERWHCGGGGGRNGSAGRWQVRKWRQRQSG